MNGGFSLDRLTNRLSIQGTLVMDTGLHIGSGEEAGAIDAGVMLDSAGRPFVPGSSLKGVLRSEAERFAPVLGLSACGLFSESGVACLSTNRDAERQFREKSRKDGVDMSALEQQVCDACKLFGGTVIASRVLCNDLSLVADYPVAVERRDGVGIDRDTGTAAKSIKYDFQVVPSETSFALRIQAENLDPSGRALLSVVLLELIRGNISIGGKRSRGLGRCHVANLVMREARFDGPESAKALLSYLADPKSGELTGDAAEKQLVTWVREGVTSHA